MRVGSKRSAVGLVALGLFAWSAWRANERVCPRCETITVRLPLADGVSLHGRLYLPPGSTDPVPAVVVCHGYLANRAFMEIPWAADLTGLGMAALFLDRRGHGRSGGTLWPARERSARLDDLEPDTAAAFVFLRSLAEIDPERVALLGHSDGGTAVLNAGSADWEVRASVVLGASVAPFQFVNHVAPQNLLLLYGDADRFVADYTDRLLIRRATRGYLVGPGRVGDFADGSARALIRVPGRGHVDLSYNIEARREALVWLEGALNGHSTAASRPQLAVESSGPARGLVFVGVAAMLVLFLAQGGNSASSHSRALRRERIGIRRGAEVLAAWIAGLIVAPLLVRRLQLVPSQLGPVVGAVLLGPTLGLGAYGAIVTLRRWNRMREGKKATQRASIERGFTGAVLPVLHGLLLSGLLFLGTRLLLLHHYEVTLHGERTVLLGIFSALALPPFLLLHTLLRPVASRGVAAATLLTLAAATAAASTICFERMAVVPGLTLAAVVVLAALQQARGAAGLASPTMAIVTTGWLNAATAVLH
jgi:dienelactone hydrolase